MRRVIEQQVLNGVDECKKLRNPAWPVDGARQEGSPSVSLPKDAERTRLLPGVLVSWTSLCFEVIILCGRCLHLLPQGSPSSVCGLSRRRRAPHSHRWPLEALPPLYRWPSVFAYIVFFICIHSPRQTIRTYEYKYCKKHWPWYWDIFVCFMYVIWMVQHISSAACLCRSRVMTSHDFSTFYRGSAAANISSSDNQPFPVFYRENKESLYVYIWIFLF